MTTTRSHFSFEQFEQVFQKMAHKIALDAVTTLKQGRTRIIIRENGTFSEVETDQHWFKFYAQHASYEKKSRNYAEHFGFDVEKKIYLISNHSTKISFYSPEEEKIEQMKERIMEFIDKIMAEASIKPVPRFTLSKYTGGQRYLDLTNKTASKSDGRSIELPEGIRRKKIGWILRNSCTDINYRTIIPELTVQELKFCLKHERRETGRKQLQSELRRRKT